jgi:hypothetical protein
MADRQACIKAYMQNRDSEGKVTERQKETETEVESEQKNRTSRRWLRFDKPKRRTQAHQNDDDCNGAMTTYNQRSFF